jgi:hypothetical protein
MEKYDTSERVQGMKEKHEYASPIRDRKNEGRLGKDLNYIWLAKGAFQDE